MLNLAFAIDFNQNFIVIDSKLCFRRPKSQLSLTAIWIYIRRESSFEEPEQQEPEVTYHLGFEPIFF